MRLEKLAVVSFAALLMGVSSASADMPGKEKFKEQIPTREAPRQAPPVAAPVQEECCPGTRLSAGVPIWFFKDEDTMATGGLYLDMFPCQEELPLNFRIGAEIRHMNLDQDGSQAYAEFPGKQVDITYLRIPIAVEYVLALNDETNFYIGGGPDILNSANDLGDTTVGGHLGGRLQYEWDNDVSVALEAGYMWARIEDSGPKMNLDGAYLIPTIGYRF